MLGFRERVAALVQTLGVRREIEEGLKDSAAARVLPIEEVVKRLNLAE